MEYLKFGKHFKLLHPSSPNSVSIYVNIHIDYHEIYRFAKLYFKLYLNETKMNTYFIFFFFINKVILFGQMRVETMNERFIFYYDPYLY